ncbi:MAG: phosphatase PAP2 family protein [Candidatus Nitrosocosmicus sp.]|nr:phosphatase PAP2 family protein [Candidatus Nitrosocosmicus sp.]
MVVSPKSILKSNSLTNQDNRLFLRINNSHFQVLNQFMIYLTQYGREMFWILVIFVLFLFGKKTGKKTAVVMSISMLVLIPIGIITKEIIERPRPIVPEPNFLVAADSEYAFPSGHALIVSSGAAVALVLMRGSSIQVIVALLLTIEAALVCLSRVYVGSHYPLDVIGGILLGVGVSFVFIWKEKWLEMLHLQINNKLFKVKI